MEEQRRRAEDKVWDEMRTFIDESRTYRAADEVTQKFQVENIEALKNQVRTQNGRVFELEKWREEIKTTIKYKKDKADSLQTRIVSIATVIMAIAAIVMFFKK